MFTIFPDMKIDEFLSEASSVAIFGHVRPDGDCVGSTTGIYNYIKDNYPGIGVDLYLENFPESYKILRGASDAHSAWTAESNNGKPYDPIKQADPDVTLPAEEREIGGLGIFIVKKTMDSVCYRRNGENNELAITKTL